MVLGIQAPPPGLFIFLILWCSLAVIMLSLFYLRGKKALLIFPHLNKEDIVYQSRFNSGYSKKTGRRRGASLTLRIIVTKDELWLTTGTIFASIAERNDLLHRIPLKNIISSTTDNVKTTISFITTTGEPTEIVLSLNQVGDFMHAIQFKA